MKLESKNCDNRVREQLEKHLSSPPLTPSSGDTVKQVVNILQGTRKTRFGGQFSEEQRGWLELTVSRFVKLNLPVQLLGMWGAVKAYGQTSIDRAGLDLWDALAVSRLSGLNECVSKVYSPGLRIRIVGEDITESVLGTTKNLDLENRISSYGVQLSRLLSSQNLEWEFESEVLKQIGVEFEKFNSLGSEIGSVLSKYWLESSGVPETERADLQSFKDLNTLGWTGILEDQMREYYLERASTEHPNSTIEHRVGVLSRYLGNSLSRYKVGMVSSHTFDSMGELPVVKVGFGAVAPGVPKSFLKSRLDYKVKTGTGNNTTPPWAGFGVFVESEDGTLEPKVFSLRDGEPKSFQHQSVLINEVSVRTDIVQKA